MQKHMQNGSALIISLVFLLILTMIGIASIQDSTLQERMAGNERDKNLAFQAAEAALRVGEDHLRHTGALFSAAGTSGLISPDYTASRSVETNHPWPTSSQQVPDPHSQSHLFPVSPIISTPTPTYHPHS